MSSDELVRAESTEIDRLVALGLGRYDAIRAVEGGLDRRTLETLLGEQDAQLQLSR